VSFCCLWYIKQGKHVDGCLPFSRPDYGNFVLLTWMTGFGHIVLRCRGGWMDLAGMLSFSAG
jgi:hypothetical protein